MSTFIYQVSSGSATATTDLGTIGVGVVTTALTGINPTHLAYGYYSVDASGQLRVVGSVGVTGGVVSARLFDSIGIGLSSRALSSQVSATDVGLLTNAIIHGLNSGGGGSYVDVKVTPAGSLATEGNTTAFISGQASALGVTGFITASCNVFQVSQNSATAAADLGIVGYGRAISGDISTLSALTAVNTAYVMPTYDVSGRAFIAGSYRSSATYLNGVHHGVMAMAVATTTVLTMGDSRYYPLMMDLQGNLKITASASLPVTMASTGVTAFLSGQSSAIGITGNVSAVTASANLSAWGAAAVSPATAITAGMALAQTVPLIGAIGVGYRSDGSSNYDPATLAKLYDTDTGANTENTMGVSLRVGANGGSLQLGCIDHAGSAVAASGFVPGTSPVLPVGYIYDETAGTSLNEDDIGAVRMDAKRAQVMVIEDSTTRGVTRRAGVTVASGLLTQPVFVAATLSTAASSTTGTTQVYDTNPLKYFSLQVASTGGTSACTATLQWSLDNANFFTLLSANAATSITALSTPSPTRFWRVVVSGAASVSASATALGMN